MRRRVLPFAALLALISASCGPPANSGGDGSPSDGASSGASQDAAALTAYDGEAPLRVAEESPVERTEDGIEIHDITWDSPGGGRVSAWLVVPPGAGPFAGLVYLHGSETDRNDFLDEAIAMAHGGAVSIVMDAPFSRVGPNRHGFLANYWLPDREREMTVQTIVDVRRAYDLLLERGDVDAARLGFVGHSWGASLGVVVAAVDQRPSSLVLITGRPSWTGFLSAESEAWVRGTHDQVGDEGWQHYLDVMAPLDAMAEIANVDATRLYLQYGSADDVVPEEVAAELISAADGAASDFYPAAHALNDDATADRVAWLAERLSLAPIGAEVLAGVGLPDE